MRSGMAPLLASRRRRASRARGLCTGRPHPVATRCSTPRPMPRPPSPAAQTWRTNLICIQPRVQMEDGTLHGALALVQELFWRRTDLQAGLAASPPLLAAYAAAALWTASKIVGVRTGSPNRSLMAQATGCHPAASRSLRSGPGVFSELGHGRHPAQRGPAVLTRQQAGRLQSSILV